MGKVFSHAATGYLSVYSAQQDPRLTNAAPSFLTSPRHNVDVVGPTPVGPWKVSIPAMTTTEQWTEVQEIELHLTISYVPCTQADCGSPQAPAAQAARTQESHHTANRVPGAIASTGVGITLCGVAALSSLLTAFGLFGIRRSARRTGVVLSPPEAEVDKTEGCAAVELT